MGVLELLVKVVVTIVNFALWISGILLIVFGSIALADPDTMVTILNLIPGVFIVTDLFNPYLLFEGMAIFMIVLGSLVFLFGFIGCHGVWRLNKRVMCHYWIFLIVGVGTEIGIIVYGALFPPAMDVYVQQQLNESLIASNYQSLTISPNGSVTYSTNQQAAAWELLQSQTHCCGVFNYTDYQNVDWTSQPGYMNIVPPSCCSTGLATGFNITNSTQFTDLGSCANSSSPTNVWGIGCWNNVIDMVWQFDYIAIIIAACLMAAQLIGIALTAHQWHKMVRESGY
jgi:hypothetical protein